MQSTDDSGDERIERVLLTAAQLRHRVRELAEAIVKDFAAAETLCLIGVLKGAFVFLADLGRAIRAAGGPPVRYDFIRARTYGTEVKNDSDSVRKVALDVIPAATFIRGRDLIVVEDILDQGFTLTHIRDRLLQDMGARSVKICVLVEKDLAAPTRAVARIRQQLTPDYVGFHVSDRWIAGYGLDAGEDFRELPGIVIVREEYYIGGNPGAGDTAATE